MIELHVNYYFKSNEDRDKFYSEAKNAGIIKASKAEAGNIRYDYYVPMDADAQIFLLEQWKDADAVAFHAAAEHFARLQEIKAKYVIKFEKEQVNGEKA